jgi:phosphatidylglycerol:prolipoprotein diacylglycerol transferase
MFPTIGDLIFYLFHMRIGFPIQTLGFFMGLAFFFSYWVFTSEFKRYERAGKINAFKRKVVIGKPVSASEIIINFLPGFLFGFKLFGLFLIISFLQQTRGLTFFHCRAT